MRLLVGLGNPGPQYAKTRHNVGFWALDAVAKAVQASSPKAFKGGELQEGIVEGEKILLFKPMQFMNTSGIPIRAVLDFYKINPADMCILADDVYVAPGSARIRKSGGDGGHNGWKSVLEHVDADIFWRVRLGAGLYEQSPEKRQHHPALDEYVLQPLPKHEQKAVGQLIDKLVPNLIKWLGSGELTEKTVHL